MPPEPSREERLRREVARRMVRELRASPALARHRMERGELALLGAALALSGTSPRREVRRIARLSSRLPFFYEQLWQHQEAWEPFVVEGRHHLEEALQGGRGAIVAPSHFGRYRWLVPTLLELGYRLALLVDTPNHAPVEADATASEWEERFRPLGPGCVKAIDSGSPTALWMLASALREGRLVLMFTDGNSGMDGRQTDASCLELPFLGYTISARVGAAALSQAAGVPIVPVYTHDEAGHPPRLRFEPSLRRAASEERKAWYERAMRTLFASLEREVLKAPHQWEEWSTFPRWVIRRPDAAPPPVPPALSPLSLPALAGRRLRLSRPHVWVLRLRGKPEIVDLATGSFLGGEPLHFELLAAAERELPALGWVRRQEDSEAALRAIVGLTQRGVINLVRAP